MATHSLGWPFCFNYRLLTRWRKTVKTVARVLSVIGVLAILAAGFAVVTLFEFDFMAGDLLPVLLTVIIGGIVVGVALIGLAALIAPRSRIVSFPLFRSSRAVTLDDPTLEEKL